MQPFTIFTVILAMKKLFLKAAFVLLFLNTQCSSAQSIYFPPLNQNAYWDTASPLQMGWCMDKVDSLYDFLAKENTKAFIVLVNGKIALEKYFGTFTQDSSWYWASAGKTLTAYLVGKAQEEGKLKITDTTSKYMGKGWTNLTATQEAAINIRHQLTMTTGLDDGVPENHCTLDTCLIYKAAPDTRWAYHNAPYTLLEKVITNATGTAINTYTSSKLLTKTGMSGFWLTVDYNNVFFSKARSMARFGILAQNGFIWNGDTLLKDRAYADAQVNTSQNINKGYGYLWWLNGKGSFMLPGLQTVFPGSYAPSAPADMFSALGKNGQILSVSKSKGIVFVRMGNPKGGPGPDVSVTLPENIWKRLNQVICTPAGLDDKVLADVKVFPNPSAGNFSVSSTQNLKQISVYDGTAKLIRDWVVSGSSAEIQHDLKPGFYQVSITLQNGAVYKQKLFVVNPG